MSVRSHILAICFAALALSTAGGVIDPFFVNFDPCVRTAYHSRGRIIEDRPVFTTLTRAGFDTKDYGNFGKIGFWNWTVSSLTGRRDATHRRPLNEMDYGIFWNYTWDFGQYGDNWKGWSLNSEILKDWLTLKGYSAAACATKSNASINEWRFGQSLENPYITPFYLLRRAHHKQDWFYARVGVRRKFALTDTLAFTPQFYTENGDNRHFERRYGKRVDGGKYHSGLMALNLILELSWKISDCATLYTSVHQFCVTSEDARDNIKTQKKPGPRRDLTIAAVGLRFRF